MNLSKKQLHLVQFGAAGLILVFSAILSADLTWVGLNLWFGALWLAIAWKVGLSPLLTVALLFLGFRSPISSELSSAWMLSVNLGMSAWTLAIWFPRKILAPVAGLLWSLVTWVCPPLYLLVLAGTPRLSRLFPEESKWVSIPVCVSLVGMLGMQIMGEGPLALIEPAFSEDTYLHLKDTFLNLFTKEHLWLLIPLVGIFEVTQKQADDVRLTWRNLTVCGVLLSLLVVPSESAIQLLFVVGFPLSAIMLSRWALALPDLISRSVFWLGLFLMALPVLQGGLS